MIPKDCIPSQDERVFEVLEGPDRLGRYVFFIYWNNWRGVRAQIFKADPAVYLDGSKGHLRVVERRYKPDGRFEPHRLFERVT